MKIEKKKALLELIKECDDVEYLRQMAKTAEVIADAIKKSQKYNEIRLTFLKKFI